MGETSWLLPALRSRPFHAGSVGVGLGVLWVESTFPALLGWSLSLHVPVLRLVGLGAAALVVCLAGACIPALRAARLEPAVALRTE